MHARCAVVSDYAHEGWCSSYQYSPGLEVALKRVVVYARVVDRTPAGVVLQLQPVVAENIVLCCCL